MADKEFKLPFYAKATIFLLGVFALITMLYLSQKVIIPIIFAIIFAIILQPFVNFLVQKRMNRLFAIIVSLTLTFIVIASFGALLLSQASRFGRAWPILLDKSTDIINQTITWASAYFNTNPQNIHEWVSQTKADFIDTSSNAIGHTLVNVGNGVVLLFLIPVYIFMMLIYQPLLIEFIRRLFGTDHKIKVNEIITQTKTLIQRYIRGLLFEAVIVAVLYSLGLLFIGIDYAILLGFIAALLNVIPYVGGLIAVSLIMIVTIATKDTITYPILVLALSVIIHIIDNSFIIPKIVASKVKINALITITMVIASGALLGVPGMIICIPLTGIVKLIFDHIEPLKPWGFLLGDTMPPLLNIKPILKKIKTKVV